MRPVDPCAKPMPVMISVHSEAAAWTAPTPLKVAGLVTSMVTGYFHSMNLPQPVPTCQHSFWLHISAQFMSAHPNTPPSSQSTCPSKAREPLSRGAQAAASFPSTPAPHLSSRHLHSVRRRCLSRRMRRARSPPLRRCWEEQCRHRRRMGRTSRVRTHTWITRGVRSS